MDLSTVLSSPYYPQSNGRNEKAVQTIKSLIKKAKDDDRDIHLALLELRNTPINDQLGSPAQRLDPIDEELIK